MRYRGVLLHAAIALVYLTIFVLWAREHDIHDGLGLQIRMFVVAVAHLGLLLVQRQLDGAATHAKGAYFMAAVVIMVLNLWTCSSAPKVFM